MASIEKSDIVIAEASKPSIGVGGEIVYALSHNKPVLALIDTQYEDKISPMLAGNPSENLYREYYNPDNLRFKINDFIQHISRIKKRPGKLIVIDGGDGSGKTTQAKLLVDYLKKQKLPVKYVDFPQYYHSFHGKVVAKFLRGDFGKINEVSPYLISLAYALDRASVKKEMDNFLGHGGYIIANRYTTSNMAHQSAKFTDEKERKEFTKWIYELEYKVHKIPKENLVIYLYVPWKTGLELTKTKSVREYLKGQSQDIAEKDIAHRVASESMYLELSKKFKHWQKVDCVVGDTILPPDTIHQKIIQILKEQKILPLRLRMI
jgi:dTMP kinase